MSGKDLRIGIVGFGFMGKMHAHAYRSLQFYYDSLPARPVIAGVATQSQASLGRALDTWGLPSGTLDFRELCARNDLDIIHCCAPNHLHKDVLLCALEHGKHVYMDKPLSLTLDEARTMAECAKRHPECITQMTFQYRFVPALLRAKQLVEEGALGRLFSVRLAYLHAGYVDPQRPFSWRLDVEKSGAGGALFDLGAHVVDLARHLFGEIAEVFHAKETFVRERPRPDAPGQMAPVLVDDLSLLTARFANGALGTIESSRVATGTQDEIRVEAHGSRGALRFNLMQPNYLEFYDQTAPSGDYGGQRGFKAIECVARYPKPSALPGPKNTIGWERFHVHAIHEFLCAVAQSRPGQPDVIDGARTQAVLDAALQSSSSRQWAPVPVL